MTNTPELPDLHVVVVVVVVAVVYLLIKHLQNMHIEIQESRTHKAHCAPTEALNN